MAKQFSVTNNAARLVNVFGKSLAPGQSVDVDDTPDNRATVKGVDGLDVGKVGQVVEKTESDDSTNTEVNKTSATGAGWSNKQ